MLVLSSNSSQMNLASSLLTDSSGRQQASAVHIEPGQQGTHQLNRLQRSGAAPASRMLFDHSTQDLVDVLMQVRARQLQRNTATGSANRCALKVCSSLQSLLSQLVLPHEAAQGRRCLHDECVGQCMKGIAADHASFGTVSDCLHACCDCKLALSLEYGCGATCAWEVYQTASEITRSLHQFDNLVPSLHETEHLYSNQLPRCLAHSLGHSLARSLTQPHTFLLCRSFYLTHSRHF